MQGVPGGGEVVSDLVEFLRARLKEDQVAAQVDATVPEPSIKAGATWPQRSPQRRLAEVDAKRRIVAEHNDPNRRRLAEVLGRCPVEFYCPICVYRSYVDAPCPTLRFLALPYAEHEDYQPEWRP
jgi:Family of unknown function (DUF6221)